METRVDGTRGRCASPGLPLPATGKTIDCESIFILRMEAGRMAEAWSQRDELAMLRQLGHFTMGAAS